MMNKEQWEQHWDYESHMRKENPDATWPKQTRWQQFWRSPWTYLLFSIYFGYLAFGVHHVWYLTVLYVVITVLSLWDFYDKADDRWGKP